MKAKLSTSWPPYAQPVMWRAFYDIDSHVSGIDWELSKLHENMAQPVIRDLDDALVRTQRIREMARNLAALAELLEAELAARSKDTK